MTRLKTLEMLCDENDFSLHIKDNTYCSLGMNKRIKCKYKYHSLYTDHNDINICLNPKYNLKDYDSSIQ